MTTQVSESAEISQSCAAGTAGTDSLGLTEQQDEACVTFITEIKKNREKKKRETRQLYKHDLNNKNSRK